MKRILLLILLFVGSYQCFTQTKGISYQAVVLNPKVKELPGANAQASLLVNNKVAVQFTILDEFGNEEFQEFHKTTTDAYGMINLIIGRGTASINDFEDVVWNGFSKKLKVEIDFSGNGTNFKPLSEQELTFMPQPALGQDAQAILDNTASIMAEVTRATNAELGIQTDVDANEAVSISADSTLQANIDAVQSEIDANELSSDAADTMLQNSIDALETDSNTAIAAVQADVDANEAASISADDTLQTNIDAVQSDIDANELSSDAADTMLQNSIDALETDSNTAIAAVQADVDANEAASISADDTLQTKIDAVQSDIDANELSSDAADTVLQNNIDVLERDSSTAISAVQADVDANEAASVSADAILQTNIVTVQSDVDANELSSDTADTVLQNNIDALETDSNTAIAAVQADVDANEAASISADAILQTNIVTVQSDVDANELSSDAADTVLQNNIDALETDSSTAIAAVQADVDANEVASVSADATLQTNIDAVQSDVDANETAANTALNLKANIASPTFTGIPLAPTAITGTNTTQIATTEFVQSFGAGYLPLSGGALTGLLLGTTGDFSSNFKVSSLTLRSATKAWEFGLNGSDLVLHQGGCCNRLTIDSDGRFGIGANYTPSYQLDVEGNGRFTSSVTATSFIKLGGTSLQFLKADGTVDAINYAPLASPTFTGTVSGIDKTMVGLGNVDNTSDANKPVSTAGQTALELKVDKVTGKGLSTEDYSTAEKTKLAAILGTNTGDQDLSGYATNTNLALKANIASPTFTGTVSGISSTMVGLGNVDNTSDANKPVSTATQTALDLKANLASPTFTGTPSLPTGTTAITQTTGNNSTAIATTAFVTTATTGKFVDLTTNQTIAGVKTFSSDVNVNGLTVGRGNFNENSNTAIGVGTLDSNAGYANTGIGRGALAINVNGGGNTALGYTALSNNISGSDNVAIGTSALNTNTSGSDNIAIGRNSNVSSDGITNSVAIGANAIVTASNTIQLGSDGSGSQTAITNINTSAAITANSYIKSGGTSGQYLMADGSVSIGSAPIREVADEFSATATQTNFTLTQTPSTNSKVKMYINGIRISNLAYSVSGTTLTYNPLNNGGYALSASDRVQFDFYY